MSYINLSSNKLKLLLALMFIMSGIFNQTSAQEWSEPVVAGGEGYSTCFDSNSNQYVVGDFFSQNFMLLDSSLIEMTNSDGGIYFAKMDSDRKIQWVKGIHGGSLYRPMVRLLSNEDILIVSNFTYSLSIDTILIYENEQLNYEFKTFIARYSPDGELKWIKITELSIMEDIYINEKDQLYLTGRYQGKLTFDDNLLWESNTITGFYLKCDSQGELLKFYSIDNDQQLECYCIIADSLENIYIGGHIYGGGHFGTNFISTRRTDLFIAKFNRENENVWVKHYGMEWNDNMEAIKGLCFDHTKKYIYTTGVVTGGTVDYGTITANTDDKNIFVGKLDLDGNVQWVNNFGNWSGVASYTEQGNRIVVDDSTGFVYLNGYFFGNASFGSYTLTENGFDGFNTDGDLFLAKLNPMGEVDWIKSCGGQTDDRVNEITIDKQGKIWIAGMVSSRSEFDDWSITEQEHETSGFFAAVEDNTSYYFSTNTEHVQLNANDEYVNIQLHTNAVWQITDMPAWLSLNEINRNGCNDKNLQIPVVLDFDGIHREGIIKFKSFGLGSYEVKVSQGDNPPTAINNIQEKKKQYSVYPTVTKDYVYLKNIPGVDFIAVYNVNGQKILRQNISENCRIDLSILSPGIYILSIEDKIATTYKVIKQ